MLGIAGDVSDPQVQRLAFTFLSKSVTVWGSLPDLTPVPNGAALHAPAFPGFERFIYDRVVPLAFRVLSTPEFNIKDGQALVVSSGVN
jgi:exportin-T